MAQIKYSVNLTAAAFTLSFSWKGQSVVIPGQDQNAGPYRGFAGDITQHGYNIPQVMYVENVIPTNVGYRSIAYEYLIPPPPEEHYFVSIQNIYDGKGSKAVIGVTADRKIFLCSYYTGLKWQEIVGPTPSEWFDTDLVTVGCVVGYAFIFIEKVGVYVVDIPGSSLTAVDFVGLSASAITGLCAANSYLIAWDDSTVYWSSTVDPLDFVPSLITGAGSIAPEALKGKILLCKEIKDGFIIYSDVVMIAAAYSLNKAAPWVFTLLVGGAGIRYAGAVTTDIAATTHFAWTSSGLVEITLRAAATRFPEVSDFIASGLEDDSVSFSAYPETEFSREVKEIRLAYVSSRYLCISFGYLANPYSSDRIPQPRLRQTFIFDTQFQRWGKLNVNAAQLFEIPFGEPTAAIPIPVAANLQIAQHWTAAVGLVRFNIRELPQLAIFGAGFEREQRRAIAQEAAFACGFEEQQRRAIAQESIFACGLDIIDREVAQHSVFICMTVTP